MASTLAKNIVYVARDIERALGMEPGDHENGSYFVVSNDTAYGRAVKERYPKHVFLVARGTQLDTYDLLCLAEVEKMIADTQADLLVFQNTLRIERLAADRNWNLLNPSALLSKTVEEKISQVAWLDDDAKYLPPHALAVVKDVKFSGPKFVLQFNHAHTGHGTHVIDSAEALAELQTRFPYRECRVTDFIEGPVFTVNAVVAAAPHGEGASVIVGNPSYQITGIAPFTDLPFATIGNDWALPQRPEYESLRIDTVTIAQAVGARLKKAGWKGLFGIDVVYDEKAKKTYLLEINARQPASTTFESQQQKTVSGSAPSIFEAHIAALAGRIVTTEPLAKISGAQIVKRSTVIGHTVDAAALAAKGLAVMEYENDGHNKELFRIQSTEGIMEDHGKLNALGKFIRSCIR